MEAFFVNVHKDEKLQKPNNSNIKQIFHTLNQKIMTWTKVELRIAIIKHELKIYLKMYILIKICEKKENNHFRANLLSKERHQMPLCGNWLIYRKQKLVFPFDS